MSENLLLYVKESVILTCIIILVNVSPISYLISAYTWHRYQNILWLRVRMPRARAYLSFVHVAFIDDNNSNAISR